MKTNDSIAIRLTKVTKRYTIHHEKPTLVEKFIRQKDKKFLALNDVSLTIRKGERVETHDKIVSTTRSIFC